MLFLRGKYEIFLSLSFKSPVFYYMGFVSLLISPITKLLKDFMLKTHKIL